MIIGKEQIRSEKKLVKKYDSIRKNSIDLL